MIYGVLRCPLKDFTKQIINGVKLELLAGIFNGGDVMEYNKKQRARITKDTECDLYDSVVLFVRESDRVSVCAIQRKFELGYNRAARLIEAMEHDGVVSPPDQNGARTLLGN